MYFKAIFVATIASRASAAIIPAAGRNQNPTYIVDVASMEHQTTFDKDQTYRFNLTSASVSASAKAVINFDPDMTIPTAKHQLHTIGPRNVASTQVVDPDDWRYFHYEGIRTGNDHWWRGGGPKVNEIKAAHDQVVTPTLPKDINIPNPLLPTSDAQVLAVYVLALDQLAAEERKGLSEKARDAAAKKKEMARFNKMNQCVHDKNFCTDLKFRDAPFVSAYYRKFKKEYSKLFNKLKDEAAVMGLVDLGRQLKAFMAETGQRIEIS